MTTKPAMDSYDRPADGAEGVTVDRGLRNLASKLRVCLMQVLLDISENLLLVFT